MHFTSCILWWADEQTDLLCSDSEQSICSSSQHFLHLNNDRCSSLASSVPATRSRSRTQSRKPTGFSLILVSDTNVENIVIGNWFCFWKRKDLTWNRFWISISNYIWVRFWILKFRGLAWCGFWIIVRLWLWWAAQSRVLDPLRLPPTTLSYPPTHAPPTRASRIRPWSAALLVQTKTALLMEVSIDVDALRY